MAAGRLGSASLSATTNTTIYTVPASKSPTVTINVCNTSAVGVTVRLAIALADTPVAGEYIEYDVTLPASGVLERAGVVLDAGKKIVAYAGSTGLNVNVWGFEE